MKRFYTDYLPAFGFLAGLLVAGVTGCGTDAPLNATIPQSSTDCTGGSAQVEIGDGFLRILCGCTGTGEDNGRIYPSPGGLTCRLSGAGATVFFSYLTTTLPHQIRSTGSPAFVSSAVMDPSVRGLARTHPAIFSQAAATYTFEDTYSGMTGQIIVP